VIKCQTGRGYLSVECYGDGTWGRGGRRWRSVEGVAGRHRRQVDRRGPGTQLTMRSSHIGGTPLGLERGRQERAEKTGKAGFCTVKFGEKTPWRTVKKETTAGLVVMNTATREPSSFGDDRVQGSQ